MIKLTVLYGNPTDPAAFDEYYHHTHMDLARSIPGLSRVEVAQVIGTPDGSAPAHYRIAELYFEDMASFQAAMGSPAGQATASDIPKFATGGATVLISEITA
ncbi:EthD family reductase [Deinococcus aerophilus]|jgi:uncharacterized protein (TIGR02118 family)|uniref:Ethyl tert-butyl ether degradation protein EthD n=1 Tax=Deinococcus aerophilus TaxID=522488 RepID=A0ABQ2GI77_9DEIO|nr:EthD family reductase [Deinococcus aerophilus]GGL96665.1 ethyl tert-butyl ether degradation protein EthD [Deinococcus aerophilus]